MDEDGSYGADSQDIKRIERFLKTRDPEVAEQLGVPTYRQIGNLEDFHARKVICAAWREYDRHMKMESEQFKREHPILYAAESGMAFIVCSPILGAIYAGKFFRKIFKSSSLAGHQMI